jgi:hypothetical protein
MEEEDISLGAENYMKSPLIKFTKKKHALVKSSFFDEYNSDEEETNLNDVFIKLNCLEIELITFMDVRRGV